MRRLSAGSKWEIGDVIALSVLRSMDCGFVPWSSWSLRPAALMSALNDISYFDRRSVVEFGSGTSTLYLARILEERGGKLISFEHDSGWAEHVQRLLGEASLDSTASVILAPLQPWSHGAAERAAEWALPTEWYDTDLVADAVPAAVDLLLVDGPPACSGEPVLIRYPALGSVQQALTDDATIILDDADRPGELEIVARWEEEFGGEFDVVDRLGIAVCRRDGGPTLSL